MQTIGPSYYDKKNRYGSVEINGQDILIGEIATGYKKDGFTHVTHLAIVVAHDYNKSHGFTLHAATLQGLIKKIRNYKQGKLTKPK